jgi:5-methyltetrahydrofolate--homocysteine methyltransferase
VHDIGKNIVGVVLGCNGYEIIDLGVMVSSDRILEEAQKHQVDIIGLSGLITPSLDEMVNVANEMKRRGMKQPLLIGGATTSKTHTAVKISQQYDNGVVHVLDASRSVSVAGKLLSKQHKGEFLAQIDQDYTKIREDFHSKRSAKTYLTYHQAAANKQQINWADYNPTTPSFTGTKTFHEHELSEIAAYIDWAPFFIAWELGGRFPDLLTDEVIGKEATKLYNDAKVLLQKIIDEKWLTPHGVIGFWPANSNGVDSVDLYQPNSNVAPDTTVSLEFLRQQIKKAPGQPNFSLADYIAPAEMPYQDYIGSFAVTIKGIEPYIQKFEADLDDYNKIMLQALADRLAEAYTEFLHEKVRQEFWGYQAVESLSKKDLIHEKYQGIRPAPGYPACPDHTEKIKLFELLDTTAEIGITLTESLAMYPASSVCGWYIAHPEAKYFGVGKITEDQLKDYAERKSMPLEEISKWLSANQ